MFYNKENERKEYNFIYWTNKETSDLLSSICCVKEIIVQWNYIGGISFELHYQNSWIVSIIFTFLIVDNVKFNLHVHAWFDMTRVVFGQFVLPHTNIVVKWTKTLRNLLKINVVFLGFLHCSIFSMPRIPNNLRERVIGMLDACMSTLQGMLGVLDERYEIFAYTLVGYGDAGILLFFRMNQDVLYNVVMAGCACTVG